ncbi:MAG: MFS transporter [Pseudomonadales bacterium]|nr:MFS transporter [Pseudomonadales bacterium]
MTTPPHGRAAHSRVFYGWWLVGAGFLLQGVAAAVVSYSYGLMMTPVAAEFEANRFQMMLGITACTFVSGFISPFLGVAIDRYPLRVLASAGVLMLALGFLALSFAQSIWHVAGAYAVFMSTAMILMGPNLVSSMLARWFTRRRGLVMGLAALGTSVCGFVVPPLLQLGISGLGWREAFQFAAIAAVVVLLPLSWFLLVDNPARRGLTPDGEPAPATAIAADALPSAASTAEILRQGNFWMVAIVLGLLFSVYNSLLSNLAPLATGRGTSAEQAAFLISVVAVCGMIGKLVFGVIADRVDLRAGLAAAIGLVILGLVLLIADASHVTLLVASSCIGLAAGGMLPVWGALMAVLFGALNYGRVMGLMSPVMMPLVVIGSPFAGWSYDVSGDYVLAFTVFVVLMVAALLALARVRLPRIGVAAAR